MKSFTCVVFLVLPLWFFTQERPSADFHELRLQEGESIILGNKSISFKRVLSDSRCPQAVSCIWPGEARIMIGIWENGKLSEEKILEINSVVVSPENLFLVDSYRITALELLPYPAVPAKAQAPEYFIMLQVKEVF